jgi:hypothetical protein
VRDYDSSPQTVPTSLVADDTEFRLFDDFQADSSDLTVPQVEFAPEPGQAAAESPPSGPQPPAR